MKKISITTLFTALIFFVFLNNTGYSRNLTSNEIQKEEQREAPLTFTAHRIAHAGGGINGETYTNSYEALDYNIKKGFIYFELDFSFTKDDQLVCIHDWTHSFKRSFGFEVEEEVTLREFTALVNDSSEYSKCTLDGLSLWMEMNPSAYIITDVKDSNIKALKAMLETLPDATRRVIPQIYDPDNYIKVKELGFEQIIWTLYRVAMSNKKVYKRVQSFNGTFAITMPEKRARSILPKKLKALGIPTYVHTINSPKKLKKYTKECGITEIYTDFLLPKREEYK